MNTVEVKNKFKEVMNEYKTQFYEDLSQEKKEAFSNLFEVSLSDKGDINIGGIYIGIDASVCKENIAFEVKPYLVKVMVNEFLTVEMVVDWEEDMLLPEIIKINHIREVYSA